MPRRARLARLWLLSGALALAGCGNRDKAELLMMFESTARHPEVLAAMTKFELAGILAMMDLTPAQAARLKAFAEAEGRTIHQTLEAKFGELAGLSAKVDAVSAELLTQRVKTSAAQEQVKDRVLGEQKAIFEGDDPPLEIAQLVEPEAEKLLPLVKGLTDRQKLIALGDWKDLETAVGDLLTLAKETPKEDVDSQRDSLTGQLLEVRGGGYDDDEFQKARPIVAKLPIGQADTGQVEARLAELLKAIPDRDPEATNQKVAGTLATLMCQTPAAELVALIK